VNPVNFNRDLQPNDHEAYLAEYFLANSLKPVKTQRRILFSATKLRFQKFIPRQHAEMMAIGNRISVLASCSEQKLYH
jgi:hypothetical protein